jgi:chromate transporter
VLEARLDRISSSGFPWLGVDLVDATNLIPGPNSTELAIHLGYRRARWRGLVAAGVCFILPAFIIVLALAWAYVRYGRTPAAAGLLLLAAGALAVLLARARPPGSVRAGC